MKKINLIICAAFLSFMSQSCDKNSDDNLEDVRGVKSSFNVTQSVSTVTEGDAVTFTVTIDKPVSYDVDFKIELKDSESTASFRDFTSSGTETTLDEGGFSLGKIGYKFKFPAFASSFTFTVTPEIDLKVEGQEIITLSFVSSGNGLGLFNSNSQTKKIVVNDYVSNDVGIELNWSKSYYDTFGSLVYPTYVGTDNLKHEFAGYDFDLYVLDGSGNDVSNSEGATSAVPEFLTISASWPDGQYDVYVDRYQAGAAPKTVFDHDLYLELSKFGNWNKKVQIPLKSNQAFSDYVLKIEKTGNTYVVKDYYTDDVLASGRFANNKSKSFLRK
jgi:hypothetical protein